MYSAAIEAAGDTRSLELDETGATDSYQLPCGYWEPNPCPQQEQLALRRR